jgi:hypothetical protein
MQYPMGVLGLKIGLMEYVLSCPKGIYNKSVNAIIPAYKISQSSNYDIRDFFMMRLLHKSMPLGFNGTYTKNWITIAIPSCTNNTSN